MWIMPVEPGQVSESLREKIEGNILTAFPYDTDRKGSQFLITRMEKLLEEDALTFKQNWDYDIDFERTGLQKAYRLFAIDTITSTPYEVLVTNSAFEFYRGWESENNREPRSSFYFLCMYLVTNDSKL